MKLMKPVIDRFHLSSRNPSLITTGYTNYTHTIVVHCSHVIVKPMEISNKCIICRQVLRIGNAASHCDLARMLVPHCLQGSQKSVFSWLGMCNNVFRIHCANVSLSCVYDGPGQAIGSCRLLFATKGYECQEGMHWCSTFEHLNIILVRDVIIWGVGEGIIVCNIPGLLVCFMMNTAG
jgi:hypothetical protein